MAEPPDAPGSSSEPAEQTATPAVAAPGIGWLLKPGASSIGLYIEVTADAAELTPEVIRGLEQLMTNAHGASEAIVHPTMMKNCGQLETCGTFKGTCSNLSSCGSYH